MKQVRSTNSWRASTIFLLFLHVLFFFLFTFFNLFCVFALFVYQLVAPCWLFLCILAALLFFLLNFYTFLYLLGFSVLTLFCFFILIAEAGDLFRFCTFVVFVLFT